MTKSQQALYIDRSSTHEFLVSKKVPKADDQRISPDQFVFLDYLKKEFPKLLAGKPFLGHAMKQLKTVEKFHAMAIQLDDFIPKAGISRKDYAAEILLDTARSIHAICKKEHGIWGQFDRDLFGCFFPDMTDKTAQHLAEKIRINLAGYRGETITIGIASYPAIDFRKSQILENARKTLDHASFFGPGSTVVFDAVTLNISGDICYQNGDIEAAKKEFKKALLLDPANLNVHNSLGVCYGVTGNLKEALKEFEKAVELNPGEVMAVYNTGFTHMLLGDYEKAMACFLDANKIDDDVFEVVFQTGMLYLKIDDPDTAKNYLKKAAELNPESGAVFRHLGECYTRLYMNNKAINAYKKAIKLNPGDASSLSAIGYLFEISGENIDIALTFCKQSIEISPDNGLYRHRLGRVYFKKNKMKNALKEFKEAEALGYESTEYIEKIQNPLSRATS